MIIIMVRIMKMGYYDYDYDDLTLCSLHIQFNDDLIVIRQTLNYFMQNIHVKLMFKSI